MFARAPLAPWSLFLLVVSLSVSLSCSPAIDRPVRGAVPGTPLPAQPPAPPTLTTSEAARARALASPSPGLAASPSAVPPPPGSPSPSVLAAPPIVRTIAPAANGRVPAGPPVTISAVLVGRGADLAAASLSINGVESGALIDRHSAREWAIHASQALPAGSHTARVLVRDASGTNGGFTWQFQVGPESSATEIPAQQAHAP